MGWVQRQRALGVLHELRAGGGDWLARVHEVGWRRWLVEFRNHEISAMTLDVDTAAEAQRWAESELERPWSGGPVPWCDPPEELVAEVEAELATHRRE